MRAGVCVCGGEGWGLVCVVGCAGVRCERSNSSTAAAAVLDLGWAAGQAARPAGLDAGDETREEGPGGGGRE